MTKTILRVDPNNPVQTNIRMGILLILLALVYGTLGQQSVFAKSFTEEAASNSKTENGSFLGKDATSFQEPSTLRSNAPVQSPFSQETDLFSSGTKAVGSLILIASLILIGAFLLKRFFPGQFGTVGGRKRIEVLETVSLGERQSLTLVRLGHADLLLARTPNGITLLDKTNVEPSLDEVPQSAELIANNASILPITDSLDSPQQGAWNARWVTLVSVLKGKGQAAFKMFSRKLVITRGMTVSKPGFDEILQAQSGVARSQDEAPRRELDSSTLFDGIDSSQLISRISQIRSQLQSR